MGIPIPEFEAYLKQWDPIVQFYELLISYLEKNASRPWNPGYKKLFLNSIFTCVYSKVLIKPKTVEIHHFRRLGFWSLNVVKRMEIWNLQNHMVNSSLISKNSKLIDFGVKWLILNPIHFRKSCSSKTLGFRKYWWDISTIRSWPVNYSSECCTI